VGGVWQPLYKFVLLVVIFWPLFVEPDFPGQTQTDEDDNSDPDPTENPDPETMFSVLVSVRSFLKFLNSHVVSTTTVACRCSMFSMEFSQHSLSNQAFVKITARFFMFTSEKSPTRGVFSLSIFPALLKTKFDFGYHYSPVEDIGIWMIQPSPWYRSSSPTPSTQCLYHSSCLYS